MDGGLDVLVELDGGEALRPVLVPGLHRGPPGGHPALPVHTHAGAPGHASVPLSTQFINTGALRIYANQTAHPLMIIVSASLLTAI